VGRLIGSSTVELSQVLPEKLESLVWLLDYATSFSLFPRFLTSLVFRSDFMPAQEFSKADWKEMPETLTQLTCEMETFGHPECVLQVPNLVRLVVKHNRSQERRNLVKFA